MKKILFFFAVYNITPIVEIKLMRQEYLASAYKILCDSIFELQIVPCNNVQEIIQLLENPNTLPDMNDFNSIENTYFKNSGTFLAAVDKNILCGMGSIKKIDSDTCELKRMFFAPAYRNKKLGTLLMQQLLNFAKEAGYQKIRLIVWNSSTQIVALNFIKNSVFMRFHHTTPLVLGCLWKKSILITNIWYITQFAWASQKFNIVDDTY